MSFLERVRELERVLLDSWPALELEWCDGWALLANEGTTGRANSVTVMSEPAEPAAQALSRAEGWYRARELTPMVRVTPLSGSELEDELERRGYGPWPSPSHVMARDFNAPTSAEPGSPGPVQLRRHASDDWWDLINRSPRDRRVIRNMFGALGDRGVFASIEINGAIVAIGHGVVTGRYLSVFNMYTREQHRRQGLAQEILQALESWALSMGAEGATLQVTIDNQAAQGLYSRLGYAPVYQYRYSRAPRLT